MSAGLPATFIVFDLILLLATGTFEAPVGALAAKTGAVAMVKALMVTAVIIRFFIVQFLVV